MLAESEDSETNLKLFASPWSAPAWMKTNNNLTGDTSHNKIIFSYHYIHYYVSGITWK